jgi:hypothetical protein
VNNRAFAKGASAFLVLAVCGASSLAQQEVLDSRVWASGMTRIAPAWIDARQVLFLTGPRFKYDERLYSLAVWDLEGKARIYRANVQDYCYKDGSIVFKVVEPDDERLIRGTWYAGRLGQEKPLRKDIEGNVGQLYDRLNCRVGTMETLRQLSARTTRRLVPLLEGHGDLDLGERVGAQSMVNEPVKLVKPGAAGVTMLPFGTRDVFAFPAYYAFADAYLLRPATIAHPVWLLKPDGNANRLVIPKGPWSGAEDALPYLTAAGLALVRDGGAHNRTDGLYLIEGERARHLLPGRVSALGVSPDGCSIAFSHAPAVHQDRADKSNRRTLKAVHLCEPAKQ